MLPWRREGRGKGDGNVCRRVRPRIVEGSMALTITTQVGDGRATSADALIVPVHASEGVPGELDARLNGQLVPTLTAGGFAGKAGDVVAVATLGLLGARWLVLTGAGARGAASEETWRRAYGAAARKAREAGA